MANAAIISELLEQWEEAQERGRPVTPEELCTSCPDLVGPLRQAIAALEAFDPLVEPTTAKGAGCGRHIPSGPPALPGYEILAELGRGGMGVVYKARQLRLDRLVAVKMILAGSHADPGQVARFRAEAEILARLQHPHIVPVHEVGDHTGQPFFIMEFVEGGSLDRKLAGEPLPVGSAARLAELLARAVQAAHQRGVVHRDLKPANVLLARSEGLSAVGLGRGDPDRYEPKITDFGLAKRLDGSPGLTTGEAILGTPSYMAPEQAAGRVQEVGPAADVYALGAVLYEMLTGRPPFRAGSAIETVCQVVADDPVPPSRLRPKLPVDLETICLKCLQKEPRRRYESAGALAEDLRRFLDGEPIRARPVSVWQRGVKWSRRRPLAAGLLAALVTVTTTGAGLVGWKWRQAEHNAQVAREQKTRAEKERDWALRLLAQFRQSVDTYRTYLTADTVWDPQHLPRLRHYLLGTTVQLQQALVEMLEEDPEEVARRAEALEGLVNYAAAHSEPGKALGLLQGVRPTFDELAREHPDHPVFRRILAGVEEQLAYRYLEQDQQAEALAAYREALRLWEQLARERPDDSELAVALARSHGQVAEVLGLSQPQAALDEYGLGIGPLEEVVRGGGQALVGPTLRILRTGRAELLTRLGRPAEALPDWDRAIALDDGKGGAGPRLGRARARARAGDHAGALTDVNQLVGRKALRGEALFQAARVCSLAAAAARKDSRLAPTEAESRAEGCARLAVALLGAARAAGVFQQPGPAGELKTSSDLAPLRGRDDFRALLAEVEKPSR